jgi:hypothetical protein
MSRNSKNARLIAGRKSYARAKFDATTGKSTPTGRKGPSRTEPKHGKKNAWFQKYQSHADFVASQKKKGNRKKADSEADAID